MSPHETSVRGISEDDINRIVHEPARLQILVILTAVESADFTFLVQQTGLTRGNLSAHLLRLEESGYIDIEKTYRDRRPLTLLRLTERGAAALKEYVASMQELFGRIGNAGFAIGFS